MRFAMPAAVMAALIATPALADPAAVNRAVQADYDGHLEDLFIHFHQNPELSSLETNTAKRMAAELRAVGADVTEGFGGTGVVGMMRNGDGPLILVRADMDGLPLVEKSGLPYASKATQTGLDGEDHPVMHACGHDVHITSLVGTARRLAAMKDQWNGTVMFIVQPAEETVGGAEGMMKAGLYEKFGKPDYALAFHVASPLPTGKLTASEGAMYSSADTVKLTVPGVGAHGASPHSGRDPIYIASQIVVALQSIVSREIDPIKPGVVTVGMFHSGTKSNIISDRADLQLTVRSNDEATRKHLISAIERIAQNVGRAHGLAEDNLPTIEATEGTPVTANDPALARRLNAVMAESFGANSVVPFQQKGMGAEDFAFFVGEEVGVPGYYFAVGGTPPADFEAEKNGGPPVPSHHSPLFKIAPREAVTLGTEAMVAAVMDLAPAH